MEGYKKPMTTEEEIINGKKRKRYNEISQKVDKTKVYTPEEALELVFETKSAKFVETVEFSNKTWSRS